MKYMIDKISKVYLLLNKLTHILPENWLHKCYLFSCFAKPYVTLTELMLPFVFKLIKIDLLFNVTFSIAIHI